MRIIRLCAGVAVGGIAMAASIAPAAAADFGPALNIGGKTYASGGQVDLLPTPYTTKVVLVPLGVATVKVGGTAPPPSDGSVASFLADPLPVKVCVLCHPVSTEEPAA
jgi:hypothetical protein